MIEPSVTYGNLYLDITREYAAKFKAGLPPATPTPSKTSTPTRAPTATATVTPTVILSRPVTTSNFVTSVRATISDTLRVRAAPSTNSEILGLLREGTPVTLLGQSEDGLWWQIPYPNSSLRGWIFGGFIDADGDPAALRILSADEDAPMPVFTPTIVLPTSTSTPEPTPTLMDTPTATPTMTPTRTPTFVPTSTGFSLRSLFPFLP
jgi:uncharacterized protein YraI